MKFWEKFQPEQLKNSETKPWWWWVVAAIGFVVGLSVAALFGILVFIYIYIWPCSKKPYLAEALL